MATPGREGDLPTLARHLAKDGPVKTLSTSRRVRLLVDGACIVDTLGGPNACLVWEHQYYPQLYFPREAFVRNPKGYNVDIKEQDKIKDDENELIATMLSIKVRRDTLVGDSGREINDKIMVFASDLTNSKAEHLQNMVKFHFSAADQWLEEDTPIFVHPKDPFKRVDILPSSRGVKVAVDGVQIAEANSSMHLYETGLPVRYYVPLTAIDTSVLRPSKTRTQCPYKGEAEYYHIVVGDKTYNDIVWFYTRPTIECATIAGLCCFYNEKVEISLQNGQEWETLEKTKSIFS